MEDIWQQFHGLPKTIRDAVATPEALATVDRLERQHPGLDLAGFVMRAMVKEFPINDLAQKITEEGKVPAAEAEKMAIEMKSGIFSKAGEYLGIVKPVVVQPATMPAVPKQAPPPSTLPVVVPKITLPPVTLPVAPLASAPVPPKPPAPVVMVPLGEPSVPPPQKPATPSPVTPPRPSIPAPAPLPLTNTAPTQNYSDDDDQEIAAQTRRVQNISASSGTIDIDQLAQEVLTQHSVAFRDELLQKRAASLFKARLKGIRDTEDTKAMLMRAPKVGGLGLDPDLAANLAASLDQAAEKLKSRGAVRPPVPLAPMPMPPIPKVQAERPAAMPPITRGLQADNTSGTPVKPLPNFTEAPRVIAPQIKRPADIPMPKNQEPTPPPAPRPAPAPAVMPKPIITRERQTDGPSMSDITRPTSTVMGPAGEMSSLTLMEFRRLGQGAADSARRLLDKFHHYQKESFPLWSDAVAGWRQSEVHRLYLDMGRQSLETGSPITQVIQERAKAGLPYLSEHEFSTVADLNRALQL